MMPEALPDDGLLVTCETSSAYAEIALRYFKKSRQIIRVGPLVLP